METEPPKLDTPAPHGDETRPPRSLPSQVVVEDNVLTPVVYGRSVKMHPLAVFIAVLCGGLLFGILEALPAIPVVALIRIVGGEWLASRTRSCAPEARRAGGE